MGEGIAFVKGQKVITPSGEGFIVEVSEDKATVELEGGQRKDVSIDELEDDSDAG